MLKINNLSVEYYLRNKTIKALRNISLDLRRNDSMGIVGESGSGKTTLSMAILKLILPYEGRITSGEVLFKNNGSIINLTNQTEREMRQIRGNKISIVFQDPFSALNPVIPVGEQITETLKAHKISGDLKETVLNILKDVQLNDNERIFRSYPHELSGGERQRICIAISVVTHPAVLIADEPTTALDVTTQKEILDLISNIWKNSSLSLILITHNMHLAVERTKRITIMYAGEIVEQSETQSIIKSPKHPYTVALFNAIPGFRKSRLTGIKGNVPDLSNLPEGCKFYERCEKRMDVCKKEEPELLNIENNHFVKCHLYRSNSK
ncbi:MAG: hypothetical protein AUJ85_04205 [Elusimicrobia bacterium CG1_02_37_114]|nr:MAG: hypothetical protein AUJ85_04205 [Elusimicrobia bacterium CG1_02_37_114]PIV52789.1 MAG: hypothetical protein COS17_07365 [Elusimicrobia bacterium CG02_land_8_20_14_3_00_37_13]